MKRIRIALLDDHAVVRHGLVSHLAAEPDIEVVGAYESSRELMRALAQGHADILLLDFSLGRDELDGVSLIRALRARFPDCRILVLSTHHELSLIHISVGTRPPRRTSRWLWGPARTRGRSRRRRPRCSMASRTPLTARTCRGW